MNAELSARVAAAAAVLADFRREDAAFTADTTGEVKVPLYGSWALRLASVLESVLELAGAVHACPEGELLAAIRAVVDVADFGSSADASFALTEIDDVLRGGAR